MCLSLWLWSTFSIRFLTIPENRRPFSLRNMWLASGLRAQTPAHPRSSSGLRSSWPHSDRDPDLWRARLFVTHSELSSHLSPSLIQTWLTHTHLFLSLSFPLSIFWIDFQFNFALNPQSKLNYERFWTHWTRSATPVAMTPSAWTSWRTPTRLVSTQLCCRRSPTSRSSCHSDSTCTVRKNFSSRTLTTDSWVCFSFKKNFLTFFNLKKSWLLKKNLDLF